MVVGKANSFVSMDGIQIVVPAFMDKASGGRFRLSSGSFRLGEQAKVLDLDRRLLNDSLCQRELIR